MKTPTAQLTDSKTTMSSCLPKPDLMFIFSSIINFFKKLKRRYVIAKAYGKMQVVFKKQVEGRKLLRSQINSFLKEYFGIDANSRYIPKDFKNAEEVKYAIMDKFGFQMKELNLNYTDLFK